MKNKILLTLLFTIIYSASSAQTFKSAYFVEGVAIRHQLNPSFAPQSGYVGIPGLGNIDLSLSSNVGISTFLYPYKDGQLNTFLHKDVSSKMFLDKLKNKNNFDLDFNLNIIQFGFYKWGGFNTFDLGVKSNSSAILPYDMFAFMKNGMSNDGVNNYDLSDIGVNSQNFVDISFGHSRKINDKLRVGAKVKLLLGIANVHTTFTDLNVSMSQDKWMVSGSGEVHVAGVSLESDATNNNKITGIDSPNIGVNGVGFAIDLGATYKVLEELEVSLAVLDLGLISWNNNTVGKMDGKPFVFEGFTDIDTDDTDSFDDQVDGMTDDIEALFSFYEMKGLGGKRNQSTKPTLNIGAEYSFFDGKLTAGVLSSTIFRKAYVVSDFMISANYTPIKKFTITGHTSFSNIGNTWGTLLNFNPRSFNIFLGATMMYSKFTPAGIPIGKLNANINLGMSVYLKNNRAEKMSKYVK